MLANLACYYMLDLRVLRALAHLLEHLCSWFNVTLGEPLSLRALATEQCDRSRGNHSLCRCPVTTSMHVHMAAIDVNARCLPPVLATAQLSARAMSRAIGSTAENQHLSVTRHGRVINNGTTAREVQHALPVAQHRVTSGVAKRCALPLYGCKR